MNKIIIAGSRTYENYNMVGVVIKKLNLENIDVILNGGARGADKLGERYAHENKIKVDKYPALWEIYGKSAGYRRNEEMAQNATHAIIFWDGESKGAKHMIDLSRKYNLKGFYYNYVEHEFVEL